MKLSIVVPTHNRFDSLLKLIHSLREQSLSSADFELCVVCNLKDPLFVSERFISATSGMKANVLCVGRVGVNRARNLGIERAQGEIILLLDDDCRVIHYEYLEKLLQLHNRYPGVVAIGGTYRAHPQDAPMTKAYNCIARQWQSLSVIEKVHSGRLVGGNVSYKKKVLEKMEQKFNEDIAYGGSELELHLRLLQMGLETLLVPELEVHHEAFVTNDDLIMKAYHQACSAAEFGMDENLTQFSHGIYHDARMVTARKWSLEDSEFLEVMAGIKLYDWTFNHTLENINLPPARVVANARKWQREMVQRVEIN